MIARLLPYGPDGWLVEVGEEHVTGYAAAVLAAEHPAVTEVVAGARTVLVQVRVANPVELAAVGDWLVARAPVPDGGVTAGAAVVEIPVVYDGEDLAAVASACGLTVAEVVSRHAAASYVCAFCGFAPGFGYLTGLDPALRLPRRATPRTRVPAGSVAIADAYSSVYPSPSPGGWHLLGHTDLTMWDPSRPHPSTVEPGTPVRFVAVGP